MIKWINIFLVLTFFLSLVNILPILNYFGKILLEKYLLFMNQTNIGWLSYLIFFILLACKAAKSTFRLPLRILLVLLCMVMIILPAYPILCLCNIMLSIMVRNPPYIYDYDETFPGGTILESNFHVILSEYSQYEIKFSKDIRCIKDGNPGFFIEKKLGHDNDQCWRSIYLKKAGLLQDDIRSSFPGTMKLLAEDDQIHNAFFSILDPNVEISPHIGYYRGYLRYHLGIIIPTAEDGSKCYLVCGGTRYEWQAGEGIVFDDMYRHYVKNPTGKKRVILYLDIKRRNLSTSVQSIVDLINSFIENHPIIKSFVKNQHVQKKIQS